MDRIGVIGLGLMGKPMARNLLGAGYGVTVHNRSRGPVDALAAEGAMPADSPATVACASDIVITMLPDGPTVEAVMTGPDGVLAGAGPGLLAIDMSTIDPPTARRLAVVAAERDVHVMDAPVSGGDAGAIAGTLSIMAGGDEADFQRARPVFEVLGKTLTYCGPHGAGQVVKACNQIAVALIIEAVSEALALGMKAGVDGEIILRVLGGGLAATRFMELRGPTMVRGQFVPGGKAKMHRKDLGIILDLARELGITLPGAELMAGQFDALIAAGGGEMDHSAVMTLLRSEF